MAENLDADEFNATCEDTCYNPLTQKHLNNTMRGVFHKHNDRCTTNNPTCVLGTRFISDNKPVEQDSEHHVKELKELNENFTCWNIEKKTHVFEFRSCFWLNFQNYLNLSQLNCKPTS